MSEPTQYLVARLRDALDLQVRIVGEDLYLTGAVASTTRRDAAEAVVRDVAPELHVHNQLDVLPVAAPTGREEIR